VLTPTNGIVCADLLRAAVEKIQNVMTLNSFVLRMPSSRYSSTNS